MVAFDDIEVMKQFLKRDSNCVSLNPVRFINVDSLPMWIEAKKFLLSLADENVFLSKFCDDRDTTPNINRVSTHLRKADKSQLVAPLSEYLRIIPEQAESVIQKFIKDDYPNNENGMLRIYFVMYRMKSLLRSIRLDDPRAKDCIVLLETDEESDYKLTIIQKELDISLPGNEIDGFKTYLEYWESNPDKPLILHTGNAIHFEKNHFFDDVRVIVTPFDLIKYQYGIPHGIVEELGTNEQWGLLLESISREGSFEAAFCATMSINKYALSLFLRWNSYTDFQRWLLWMWTRLQSDESYAAACAKACTTMSDFVDELYCRIISCRQDRNFGQLYDERKRLLSMMETVPTDRFWSEVSELQSIDALSCLTSLTDIERKTIFDIVSGFAFKDRGLVLPTLKRAYPQLYYYLQNDQLPNSAGLSPEHEKYFSEYKWLKATDTITGDFISKVKRIALEKGASVFQMKPRNHYVSKHYDDHSIILFVDGMGIEYADYLANLFSDLDEHQYSVTVEAGFCVLPSVTGINKDFLDGRKTAEPPVRELDEMKHSNNVPSESLIKQFRILDGLKDRALGLLVGDTRRVIITSDHGTSRLAVKVRNTEFDNPYPKPENIEVYKYGRFCEGTKDEPDYPTAINYNDHLIFADYSRFIQNGAPIDEIHGGASLEEWIVPIITIDRYAESMRQAVTVIPKNTRLKPDLGTGLVKVSFTISGEKRGGVIARAGGASYQCDWKDGVYSFSYAPSKAKSQETVRIVDGGILGEFVIEIEHGIKKNANFDI